MTKIDNMEAKMAKNGFQKWAKNCLAIDQLKVKYQG